VGEATVNGVLKCEVRFSIAVVDKNELKRNPMENNIQEAINFRRRNKKNF